MPTRTIARCVILWFACAPVSLFASDELSTVLARIFDKKEFNGKRFGPARWVDGGGGYTTLEPTSAKDGSSDIVRYDAATGKREILVPASALIPAKGEKPLTIEDYIWSPDTKRLLIFTASKKVWRSNTRGDYWVLDRESQHLRKLGAGFPPSSLMFAKWAPDGSQIAYVHANNIYIEGLSTGSVRKLTSDGTETTVNGTSDWVYEEELGLRDAFRWSPDGRSIAYWQFDSSGVKRFTIINNTDGIYPSLTTFPYPKAGTSNSAVRVGVISVDGGSTQWIQTPGDPRNTYIARMEWAGSSRELWIEQLNRLQNRNDVLLANAQTGAVRTVFHDQDAAWIDYVDNFNWLSKPDTLIWLSERDGWRHAYAVSRGKEPSTVLTPGAADVIHLYGADPAARWLYYIASPQNAAQRYLFRSRADGSGETQRLTPSTMPGTHVYDISPDYRWAFHTYSRIDQPPVIDLVSLPDHHSVRVLEDNAALRAAVQPLVHPSTEFLQVDIGRDVSGDRITLDGWLMKPSNFDPSKKYPLLLYVYGEPASVTATDAWQGQRTLFHHAIANDGYLVASFDNRGTPAPKGRAWRKVVYGAVGVLSSKEQTAAVRALAGARPYIDLDRVAVWGWSGGGSNTLNLMFRSPDLFKVGIAVAPVPDQRLYDTIYQERYMGLPEQNPEGYRSGSPISFAEGLRGKLLLIHGSGDDNVHFQGSQLLVNKLVELGKTFDFMEYPNRSHAISEGKGTSFHVYSLIARYLEEHLRGGPPAPLPASHVN